MAERLRTLASSTSSSRVMNHSLFSDENLSIEQRAAIDMALTHPVSILTGGPGTGKTTCLKALIATLEHQHMKYALVSPTGRAAKRLSEATGRSASTIHRLLEYSPLEGFKTNDENPLDLDFLVVDEASMLDLLLTNNLLKAVRPGTSILFVGDVDQLPSVGAGDVLRNLIHSSIAPVARLSTIFRQAAHSRIITNAHLINQGKFPDFSQGEGDFFLFAAEDATAAADWIIQIVTERVPQKFGFDAIHDIQVMAPIYRGQAGVIALNDRPQEKLNPPANNKPERRLFGTLFRLGDKVMGTYKGIETVIWLEVEAGKKSQKDVVDDLMGRYKQARAFAEERKINVIFAVLSLPWVLRALENYGLFLIPGSVALLFDNWRHRGYLPVLIFGGFNSFRNDYVYIKNLSQIIKKNTDIFLPKLLPALLDH